MKYDMSSHAHDMMNERQIPEEWVKNTLDLPDCIEKKEDGTIHYIKNIVEYRGRFLRVVVNPIKVPRVITLFFDRRLKKEVKEIK